MDIRKEKELNSIVEESYRLSAKHFSDTRKKGYAEDFLWAASQISAGDTVLDAGCGSGRLLDVIPISADRYLGIDSSEELLALARESHPGYRFEKHNLLDIKLSAKFDSIFCSAVILHIPGEENRKKALSSLLERTKEGGSLIISSWKFEGKYRRLLRLARIKRLLGLNPYGWNEIVFDWKGDDGRRLAKRYYHYFSRSSFIKEVSSSGWKIKEFKDSNYNYWIVATK